MGCAIGMTVAAACEIIYWITLKPLVKWMAHKYGNRITSKKLKYVYTILFIAAFLSWVGFSVYRFRKVYFAHHNRKYFT